jgi:DNA repair protein RecN (Recombination protein N)
MDNPSLEVGVLAPRAMLTGLSIRDFVMIESLDLELESGLCVLTGETGAGKSILLDALGLCLGDRASAGLVRKGKPQADVTAVFDLPPSHSIQALLEDHDLSATGQLILRRVVSSEGRSRAFANDRPVSAGFLRDLGMTIVEVQGQHDLAFLFDSSNHRYLLDQYAGLEVELEKVVAAFNALRMAEEALDYARAELEQVRADEDFMRHVVEEMETLGLKADEEDTLAAERSLLIHADRLVGSLSEALDSLTSEDGAQIALRRSERALERSVDNAVGRFDEVLFTLQRAGAEAMEAVALLEELNREFNGDPARLAMVEERLFDLRSLARKHNTVVSALPALHEEFVERLAKIDSGENKLSELSRAVKVCHLAYQDSAENLSDMRRVSAEAFDRAVNAELPPLKLGDAIVETSIEALPEDHWGREGMDRVTFHIATGPGQQMGPLSKVASGGELSRIMLALKVVLSQTRSSRTLIFDEVDRGIGGATADAVGARLEQLAQDTQVLVVTHSPQVAARGNHHWLIRKTTDDDRAKTIVDRLNAETRREELARMLAGARITDEARAAADSLIAEQKS